jgi:hypothetical protein
MSTNDPGEPTTIGQWRVAGTGSVDPALMRARVLRSANEPPPVPPPPPPVTLRAFPEAEGWGAVALKTSRSLPVLVHQVTTTNDTGTGSLRDILTTKILNDRYNIVIFRTGGLIQLGSEIRVSNALRSNVYIAGQTAPGGGIALRGNRLYAPNVTDWVVRYIRFRGGTGFGMIFHGERIILDHVTGSWTGTSDNVTGTSSGNVVLMGPRPSTLTGFDYTTQHCLLYQPKLHPTVLVYNSGADGWAERSDSHKNVLMGPGHRMPKACMGGVERHINNIAYNWSARCAAVDRAYHVDFINNWFKPGPSTGSNTRPFQCRSGPSAVGTQEQLNTWTSTVGGPRYQTMYLSGNRSNRNNWNPTNDPWANTASREVGGHDSIPGVVNSHDPVPAAYIAGIRRYEPIGVTAEHPITVLPMTSQDVDNLTAQAGAYRRLNADGTWTAARDSVDQVVIDEFYAGTGYSSDSQYNTVGMPYTAPAAGTPPTDTDGDGVPDAWVQRFYGVATLAAAGVTLGSTTPTGYLVIEHYLNGTDPFSGGT